MYRNRENDMELSVLTKSMLEIFKADDTSDFLKQVKTAVLNNDFAKHEKYLECVKADLSIDYMQKIFQYHEADRKEKMQDYTPKSLAESIAKLSAVDDEKVCYDMCSGSGALTIQKWLVNNKLSFICEEFDERVIPLLLFNLSVRNIKATIIHGDILSGERFSAWETTPSERFANVKECNIPIAIKADTCISNPPYNMKWEHPTFASGQERFVRFGLAPQSNANYAFITTALSVADKVSMIMPNGVLITNNKNESQIRKLLVKDNIVESIILCPDKMFESTSIPVSLITFNKSKIHQNISFIDMRKTYTEEQREQRGQFGGASHKNRVYKKTVNIFTEDQQELFLKAISEKTSQSEFSKSVHISAIQDDCSLAPSSYIDFETKEAQHRPYKDIVSDLNHIIRMRNMCKLVVNETIAKKMGIHWKKNDDEVVNAVEKATGMKLLKSDYIKFTKNKNELAFVNNDNEELSVVFQSLLGAWRQQVMFLNTEENRKLVELRDALLPDLMSGKIKL